MKFLNIDCNDNNKKDFNVRFPAAGICAAAGYGADRRYSIHTSGLNSSVYVNMLYFANLVNQYATDFTLVTLPSEGGPSNMISVNEGRASFGTSTAESVKEAYDGMGEFNGRPQRRLRHVASFGFSLMFIYIHPDSNIQSIADLKGRKIVYGGGTGSALLGKQILDVYGISSDVTAVRGDTDKARQALEKKEIDAVFSIARLPVPAYSEMVKRQTLKIIPLDSAQDSSAAKALAALSSTSISRLIIRITRVPRGRWDCPGRW